MLNVKPYLQLTRAHTAPLEAIPALLGAFLATQGELTLSVILWLISGLLYHLAGYSMNSLVDWQKGYDKDDPGKQHHPLNSGELTEYQAKIFTYGLFAFGIIYTAVLAYPSIKALVIMAIGIIFGVLYNIKGKETQYKFVYISIAHSTVFAIPYAALGGNLSSPTFLLGIAFVFVWVVFQISVSGEIKDIVQDDEENFLRHLGTEVEDYGMYNQVTYSQGAQSYAHGVKALNIAIALGIIGFNIDIIALGGVFASAAICLFITVIMISSGIYDRQDNIQQMSLIEMFTAFMFVFAVTGIIDTTYTAGIIIISVLWVVTMNKYMWDSFIGPKV